MSATNFGFELVTLKPHGAMAFAGTYWPFTKFTHRAIILTTSAVRSFAGA